MTKLPIPKAIFNTAAELRKQDSLPRELGEEYSADYAEKDYRLARDFLLAYQKNRDTFRTYRTDIERLLQWSWLVKKQSVLAHRRQDIEELLEFCQHPPKSWVDNQLRPRFIRQPGSEKLIHNPKWRPFVNCAVQGSKRALVHGRSAGFDHKELYQLSESALKIMLAAWGSFYNYLIQEEVTGMNPVLLIKQKSALVHRQQQHRPIRRLSNQQMAYVIKAAERMAEQNPSVHNRTLFIIEALFGMYLRISELASSPRWTPMMNHFFRDSDGNWWFKVLGKGNKERDISVSDAMLLALQRYRRSLGLTPLPSSIEQELLLPRFLGQGGISNTRHLRAIVQSCFDYAERLMEEDGLAEQAKELKIATVHWLRHTGISEDVKIRPREHVRDDAGHSSSAITDRYIDVERRARHQSARYKPLIPNSEE